MSSSPILQSIIAGVVALVTSATGVLAGLGPSAQSQEDNPSDDGEESLGKKSTHTYFTVVPLCLVLVGIVCGGLAGILTRTRTLVGLDPERIYMTWKKTGLSREEIYKRVFDQLYPSTTGKDTPTKPNPLVATYFFSSPDERGKWRILEDQVTVQGIRVALDPIDPSLTNYAVSLKDSDMLEFKRLVLWLVKRTSDRGQAPIVALRPESLNAVSSQNADKLRRVLIDVGPGVSRFIAIVRPDEDRLRRFLVEFKSHMESL